MENMESNENNQINIKYDKSFMVKGRYLTKEELKSRLVEMNADLDPIDDTKLALAQMYDTLKK